MSRPGEGTIGRRVFGAFVTLTEAILVALCFPLVILLLGLPLFLVVRLILEIAKRL